MVIVPIHFTRILTHLSLLPRALGGGGGSFFMCSVGAPGRGDWCVVSLFLQEGGFVLFLSTTPPLRCGFSPPGGFWDRNNYFSHTAFFFILFFGSVGNHPIPPFYKKNPPAMGACHPTARCFFFAPQFSISPASYLSFFFVARHIYEKIFCGSCDSSGFSEIVILSEEEGGGKGRCPDVCSATVEGVGLAYCFFKSSPPS